MRLKGRINPLYLYVILGAAFVATYRPPPFLLGRHIKTQSTESISRPRLSHSLLGHAMDIIVFNDMGETLYRHPSDNQWSVGDPGVQRVFHGFDCTPYERKSTTIDSLCGAFTSRFEKPGYQSVIMPCKAFFGSQGEMYHSEGTLQVPTPCVVPVHDDGTVTSFALARCTAAGSNSKGHWGWRVYVTLPPTFVLRPQTALCTWGSLGSVSANSCR